MPAYVASLTEDAVNDAIQCAGVGGEVIFPPGVIEHSGLSNPLNDQIWTLDRNTKLLRNATTTEPSIKLVSDKLTIRGGIIDGNRGVNPNQAVAVDGTSKALDIRQTSIRNIAGWGIAIDDGALFVDECTFSNIGYSAIIWRAMTRAADGTVRYGPKITRCEVDHATGYADSPAITLHGKNATIPFQGADVSNNRVRMPSGRPDNAVGIELWYSQRCRVMGNDILAGRIGISFGWVDCSSIVGNTASAIADYAIELVSSDTNGVSGNVGTGISGSIGMIRLSGTSKYNRGGGNAASSFPSTVSDVSSNPALNTF